MTDGDETPEPRRRRGLQTGRLEALSDGVYAIAITLLVLDIVVPVSADGAPAGAVARLWPSYLAYVVSFSTIGASWLGHNVITEYLDRANAMFVRLNLLLLLLIAVPALPHPAVRRLHREERARAGRVHDLRDQPAPVVHAALGAVAVRAARPAGPARRSRRGHPVPDPAAHSRAGRRT